MENSAPNLETALVENKRLQSEIATLKRKLDEKHKELCIMHKQAKKDKAAGKQPKKAEYIRKGDDVHLYCEEEVVPQEFPEIHVCLMGKWAFINTISDGTGVAPPMLPANVVEWIREYNYVPGYTLGGTGEETGLVWELASDACIYVAQEVWCTVPTVDKEWLCVSSGYEQVYITSYKF